MCALFWDFLYVKSCRAACEGRSQTSRIGTASREVGSDRQNNCRSDVLSLMFLILSATTLNLWLICFSVSNIWKLHPWCFTLAGTPVQPSLAAFSFSNLETSPLAGATLVVKKVLEKNTSPKKTNQTYPKKFRNIIFPQNFFY